MTPEAVIDEMIQSGLRGRGGAAFPTGQKWRIARAGRRRPEVRRLQRRRRRAGLLHGPHRAGRRSARDPGRDAHRLLRHRRQRGLHLRPQRVSAGHRNPRSTPSTEAEKRGLLGDNIFGSGWSFRVTVRRGAGAYICGEETALIESLEGHAGEPRTRPPYPVTAGLWGKPTVVNNVKTWASVAPILTRGAAWYAGMGTKRTPGTTIFSLEGAVKNAGLVEVPFGITLRELVYEIGGGHGRRPAAEGRPGRRGLARLHPAVDARPGHRHRRPRRRDDHDRHRRRSSCWTRRPAWSTWRGSSSDFFLEESCGKCVPCREGIKQMSRLLTRICEGQATAGDLALLGAAGQDRAIGGGVRHGQHGARRRADHAGAFPRRVRDATSATSSVRPACAAWTEQSVGSRGRAASAGRERMMMDATASDRVLVNVDGRTAEVPAGHDRSSTPPGRWASRSRRCATTAA